MTDDIPVLREILPEHTVWRQRESVLRVGVAQIDLTPPVGIRARNWGAARIGHATGIHHPLRSGVLALADGDADPQYIATLDLCTFGDTASFTALVTPILEAAGITQDRLLLHLVHTHAGPSIAETDVSLPGADMIPAYRQQIIDGVVAGIREAQAALEPATISWTYGRCQLAVNRDLPCGERDVTGFNPTAAADDTLAVGRVTNEAGEVTAVLANYACHPTTLAFHNNLISPDFIGSAREVVEEALGVPLVFFQGASGELSPRDQYVPGVEMADRNGRQLGYAVMAAVNAMSSAGTELAYQGTVESGAPLAVWQEAPAEAADTVSTHHFTVPMNARRPLTSEELAEKWSHIDPVASAERAKRALVQAQGYVVDGVAEHPVWMWQLGDAVIVAHSGEAFSALQTELRRRHPDRMIFVLNLTNGPGSCYLPSREAYEHDRYQVWQSLLEPGSLEALIDAIDAQLSTLPAPRAVVA